MAKSKHDPEAVYEYLSGLPESERAALEALRQLVKTTVPDIKERISYGETIIFASQRDLVGCASQRNHLSFFMMSPPLAKTMKDKIVETHKMSGATIHFDPDNPLPDRLLTQILEARLAEEADR